MQARSLGIDLLQSELLADFSSLMVKKNLEYYC